MLSISRSQMDTLGAYTAQRFVMAMVRHLRRKFAQRAAGLSDEVMADLVRRGVDEAEGHGVVFERDIRRYLEYMVIYGAPLAALPNAPWLGDILRRSELSASARLDRIGEHELKLLRDRRAPGRAPSPPRRPGQEAAP